MIIENRMKPVKNELEKRISDAMKQYSHSAGIAVRHGQVHCPAMVTLSTDAKFGDYQANGVMALAKIIKADPVVTAKAIINEVDLGDICENWEVAGPGFINLRLKPDFVAKKLLEIATDTQNRLGIDKATHPKTIVVDFSGPNIAKEMHVGHLRSTIIGDCICRILGFFGHNIIRQNHIGDWGMQIGIVVYAAMKRNSPQQAQDIDVSEKDYQQISALIPTDSVVDEEVHETTRRLQEGGEKEISLWKHEREKTLRVCFGIYDLLGGIFKEKDIRGESFYKDMLEDVVAELLDRNIAEKSQDAICVFPEGFKNKEGEPLPFIIQKSDGAYLYATTDLAALKYRVEKLKADSIIYVTDARQKLHFEMLFAVARMAGWDRRQKTEDGGQRTDFVHVTFGSVLGENGKPLKTREGENVKLKDLLDEAVERAKAIVEEKNPDLSAERKAEIAKAVGIGAVKYADFSNNRTSDYVFSFDKMLAMDGNTAPYMQYAYARVQSIKQKGRDRKIDVDKEIAGLKAMSLTEPAELDLAKQLIRYAEAIQDTITDYRPNYLTAYLYELAQKFSVFYKNCPVLDAGPDKRPTRLLLCDLTAKTIKHGLSELLGIEVVEQM